MKKKIKIVLGVVLLLMFSVVLYMLLRSGGDNPETQPELTEEMQTPRVPRADRVVPAPIDSTTNEDGTTDTADEGKTETDIQDTAVPAQSGEERPVLTPLQQERYNYFAKWGAMWEENRLETSRFQHEQDYSMIILNERWAYDSAHPDYQKFEAERTRAWDKLRETREAIARFFAPEVIFDADGNLETLKVQELVGGQFPPEYLEARQSAHDREMELLKKFHVPQQLRYGRKTPQGWIPYTPSELEEMGIILE